MPDNKSHSIVMPPWRTLRSGVVLTALCFGAAAWGAPVADYSFMWWAHGWPGRIQGVERTLCIQTNQYGVALDVARLKVLHMGEIMEPLPYGQAVAQDNSVVFDLPEGGLQMSVSVEGKHYYCQGLDADWTDLDNYPVRLIESGRYVQRMDFLGLLFKADDDARLEAAGRLEVVAWPDRMGLLLEITPDRDLDGAVVSIHLRAAGRSRTESSSVTTLRAGEPYNIGLSSAPRAEALVSQNALSVSVTAAGHDTAPLPTRYDPVRGWHLVDLPEKTWDKASEPDHLDRYPVILENGGEESAVFRLLFAFDESFTGVTGIFPMLRDAEGNPTGIPVQISKNWHRKEGLHSLYQGPWFHGFTMVSVPAGETWRGELAIAYARWGGVPAVSHAQLCLIGWGTNQLWDQVAIGSWGESICYDPDVNLGRSMIDDVRPLMVTNMGTTDGKWGWTTNVGGGDFLVYHDDEGTRQPLSRMRTAYERYGPNLTKVTYAGVTTDGHIAARLEVSSPRCDDLNRAYHRIRYDVLKPTPFERLAFYQLGADNYNDHQFNGMARGNADEGLLEEWQPERGGREYTRTGIACEGESPWFSLHDGLRNEAHPLGAWANRGLVIRSWRAQLGGQTVGHPFASVYGTDNGLPSANLEISAPPDCTRLEPGDFVEAEFELLVIPVSAEDYYGPDASFKAHLEEHGNTWRPVWRQAHGNNLDVTVTRGALQRSYPILVRVDEKDEAELKVTGGVGYVPITFEGISRRVTGALLELRPEGGKPVDQSVHGSDFWQLDRDTTDNTWAITYNVCLDTGADKPVERRFVFQPEIEENEAIVVQVFP